MPTSAPDLVPDLAAELAVASAAAREAGRIQMGLYERLETIDFKAEKDIVTVADHESEAAILGTIRAAFPDDAFLAEESGGSADPAPRVWVIDPLDGTVNYANGIPFFAVSIGLVVGGEPVLGVVYDPSRAELFSAVRGRGAYLDDRPVRNPDKERLEDAVVSLGLPSSGFGRRYREIRRHVRITRAMGSATLALTYLANGRFDAYVQWSRLSVWDICAAGVIASEGGAVLTSVSGGQWFDLAMPSRSIGLVAAMPRQHRVLLDLLASE